MLVSGGLGLYIALFLILAAESQGRRETRPKKVEGKIEDITGRKLPPTPKPNILPQAISGWTSQS